MKMMMIDDSKIFMMTVTQNMIEEINNDNIKDYKDDDNDMDEE